LWEERNPLHQGEPKIENVERGEERSHGSMEIRKRGRKWEDLVCGTWRKRKKRVKIREREEKRKGWRRRHGTYRQGGGQERGGRDEPCEEEKKVMGEEGEIDEE
jgi:hypothetical protein